MLDKVHTLLDTKIMEIETKLIKALEDKLSTVKEYNCETNGPSGTHTTFANVLANGQTQFKEVIREIKNDDKIEESEIEKRSKNFIIHGADEIGDSPDDIKKEDQGYVLTILEKLEISSSPESVLRLGKPNERKKRPIKVTLKNKAEKTKLMNKLGKLKGTEEELGRISITDDHTASEREEIKKWVTKAKEKTEEDPDKVYKVRGDPKNGLRLIWFPKNQ